MITWLQRNPLVLALAALAVVLLVVIGVETGFGAGFRAGIPASTSKKAVPFEAKLLPSIAAGNAEQLYPETAARPLFIPTRRPAPEVVAQSTFQPGQFVLQGVIVVGENRIALLREKSSGRIHRVERGKEVSGVKVAEINREAVTLTQGNGREVLELQVQKAGAAPAAGAMAPAGPFGAAPVAGAVPGQGGNPLQAAPNASTSGIPNMNVPPTGINATPPPTPPGGVPSASGTAQSAPISPEELLARRRARRGQQSQ
jgi:hypothetical protein